ncbi:MAG TPA: hypothetical protein PKM59_03775 [Thermodesulfobacteriota bacterium]|nr:hypothetical protein [Thermodesulfobacteriota bacterium]
MLLAIYDQTPGDAIKALEAGARALGMDVIYRRQQASNIVDRPHVGAVCGLKQVNSSLLASCKAVGVPVLVVEWGHLLRSKGYHQVNINQLCWLPPVECPPDRFDALGLQRAKKMKRNRGEYVLVCGQTPGDAQHGMGWNEMIRWQQSTILTIKSHTKRPVVFRPHPNIFNSLVSGGYVNPPEADRISNPNETPLIDDIRGAFAMVTLNSTSGQEALLEGVPVFCDPMAIYSGAANTDLADIEHPKWRDTEDYFNRLAYTQWTFEELRTGEPIQFLNRFIEVRHVG